MWQSDYNLTKRAACASCGREHHRPLAVIVARGPKGDRRIFVRDLERILHFTCVCPAARELFFLVSLTMLRSAGTIARRFSTLPMTAGSTWIPWRGTPHITAHESSATV